MTEQKPLSMRDIARMAGVSIATVSRVINNNGRFSEETRERVQKIIDENGYVTNMAAKSLREARAKTIGMIVPDISNDFFSTLALHTEQTLAKHGYSVFVCNNGNSVGYARKPGHDWRLASTPEQNVPTADSAFALSDHSADGALHALIGFRHFPKVLAERAARFCPLSLSQRPPAIIQSHLLSLSSAHSHSRVLRLWIHSIASIWKGPVGPFHIFVKDLVIPGPRRCSL